MGYEYPVIAFLFGLATAIIGKSKGSSFWLWLLIGAVLPILGLIAVILYRREKDEPERQCPTCHKAVKLYVQVCPRCGTDLYLPDPAAVRHPGVSHPRWNRDRRLPRLRDQRHEVRHDRCARLGRGLYLNQVLTIALAKPRP